MAENKAKPPATTPNLYERLVDIAGSLTVEKSGHMTEGAKYDYTKVEDIIGDLKPLLKEHGIAIVPIGAELLEATEFKTRSGSLARHTRVRVTHRVVDAWDPTVAIDIQSIGEAADTGDKGTQKAITSAGKYLLINLFKIVTGEAMDTDGIAAPEGVKESPADPRPAQGTGDIPKSNGVDSNQLAALEKIAATMPTPWATPVLKARLERFGFEAVKADLFKAGAKETGELNGATPPPPPPPPPAPSEAAA